MSQQPSEPVLSRDRFGNPLDPTVGYARGTILDSSLAEANRRQYAMALIRKRTETQGENGFFNLTGLHRDFPIPPETLPHANEWTGPAFFQDQLVEMAREHFGGGPQHGVAVFNRATAGIVATILELAAPRSRVLSVIPGKRSHPSIIRGTNMAGAKIVAAQTTDEVDAALARGDVSLIVITGVNSELEVLSADLLQTTVAAGRRADIPVFIDDAYGTRLRPIIYGGPKSLATGADVAITACDKAGMNGPRAGLMVGEADLVDRINTKAGEMGLEARPPLALGVWASLKQFDPTRLKHEVLFGREIYAALCERYGSEQVVKSGIGASFAAETVYELVKTRQPEFDVRIVPAEITAAVGMFWLARYGIIMVNALGQPGASIWLRFKPAPAEIERFGGLAALISALEEAIDTVARSARSLNEMRGMILGPAPK